LVIVQCFQKSHTASVWRSSSRRFEGTGCFHLLCRTRRKAFKSTQVHNAKDIHLRMNFVLMSNTVMDPLINCCFLQSFARDKWWRNYSCVSSLCNWGLPKLYMRNYTQRCIKCSFPNTKKLGCRPFWSRTVANLPDTRFPKLCPPKHSHNCFVKHHT
jgi:hypothetical protein